MSLYLIGDVQGCYEPLQRLLEKIRFDPADDHLVFCGDLVSRGGHSLEVLQFLYSIRKSITVVLGNHDFHLMAEDQRYPNGESKNREFRQILQSADREKLIGWVSRQRLAHWIEKHGILAVHAGVIPQWTAQQTLAYAAEVEKVLRSPKRSKFLFKLFRDRRRLWHDELSGMKRRAMITHILTRIRYCDAAGKLNMSATGPPGTQPEGYLPWFKHKHRRTRDVTIAFGHWASLGLRVKKRYVALDSGCVWGNELSAWRPGNGEDAKLVQVPYEPPRGSAGKKAKKKKKK